MLRSIYVRCPLESRHYHQPHKLMPQETETLLSQGISEDICNLLSRINGFDDDSSVTKKSSEMIVLDGNVLFQGVNFGFFATVMQISLSSQTVQRNTGSLVNSPNNPAVSFMRPTLY